MEGCPSAKVELVARAGKSAPPNRTVNVSRKTHRTPAALAVATVLALAPRTLIVRGEFAPQSILQLRGDGATGGAFGCIGACGQGLDGWGEDMYCAKDDGPWTSGTGGPCNNAADNVPSGQGSGAYGTVGSWNTAKVGSLFYLFYKARAFNQPVTDWDVSRVTSVQGTFCQAHAFNQPLSDWDVSRVASFRSTFSDARAFNQPLSDWDVSRVTSFRLTFSDARAFNQPLSDWDVRKVTDMSEMFWNAAAFRQEKFCGHWSYPMADDTDMFKNVAKGSIGPECTCICDHGFPPSGSECTLDQARICTSCSTPGYSIMAPGKTCTASSCAFSTATQGSFVVPVAGCKLTQMITLGAGDAMNVSGVATADPLHELQAVGGTPTLTHPNRHFLVKDGAQLFLHFLTITEGKMYVNADGSWELSPVGFGGASLYILGVGTFVDVTTCSFICNAAYGYCAQSGGFIRINSQAKLSLRDTLFEGGSARQYGGAIELLRGAHVTIIRSTFRSNKAVAIGGAISIFDHQAYSDSGPTATLVLSGGENTFEGEMGGANTYIDKFNSATNQHKRTALIFDVCPPGTYQPAIDETVRWATGTPFTGCPRQCPSGSTTPGHGYALNKFPDATTACTVTCAPNHPCVSCPKGRSNDASSEALTSAAQCLGAPESVSIVRITGPRSLELLVKPSLGGGNANVTHYTIAGIPGGNIMMIPTANMSYTVTVPEASQHTASCDLEHLAVRACNDHGCSLSSVPKKDTCVLACRGGTFADAGTCVACAAGQYSDAGALQTSAQVCKACSVGRFSQAASTQCKICPSGRFVNLLATSRTSIDEVCQVCPPGKYVSDAGSSSCKFCARGLAFTTTDAACEGCPPGTFQNRDDAPYAACSVCKGGMYSAAWNASACVACPAGRNLVVVATGAEYHDAADDCRLCPARTYNFQPGLSMPCFDCETANATGATSCDGCDPGKFKAATGTTNDCVMCAPGRFSSIRDAPQCTACPRGFHGVEGDAAARIKCNACPRGTFGDATAMTRSSECKNCTAGRYSDVDALPSTGAGTSGAVPCQDCPRGRWSDATRVQESGGCKNCDPGKYSTVLASKSEHSCTECKAGKHSVGSGLSDPSQCLSCPSGFSQPKTGQVFCFQCVPGQFQDQHAQPHCRLCASNHFANTTEMTACHACASGTSTLGRRGAATCQRCAAGKFGVSCSTCAAGQYRTGDDPDATQCNSCPTGFYQPETGTTYCLGCEPGQYAEHLATKNCTRCAAGKIVAEKRSASAASCKPCAVAGTLPNDAQSECVRPFVNGLAGVPEERQRWTEGGTFTYPIRLNFEPPSPVIVRVTVARVVDSGNGLAAVSPAVGCNITHGKVLNFSVATWNTDQTVSVTMDDDDAFLAKDAVSFSCRVTHTVVAVDGGATYASATLLLDAVSTGCGTGEFYGDFYRGEDGSQCVCSSEHFLPLASDCVKCPSPQSDCKARGLRAPRTAEGFWRSDPGSSDLAQHPFYICPFKLACPGGNSTAAQCAKGHDTRTPLCASCLPGYFLQGVPPMQKCEICPDRSSTETLTWELAVLTGGGFAVFMVFVMWFVSQPAISKQLERTVVHKRLHRLTVDSFEDGEFERIVHEDSFQQNFRDVPLTRAETRIIFRRIDNEGDTPGSGGITLGDVRRFLQQNSSTNGTRRPPPPPRGMPGPGSRSLARLPDAPRVRRAVKDNDDDEDGDHDGDASRRRRESANSEEAHADSAEQNAVTIQRMHSQRARAGSQRAYRVGGLLMKFKLVLGFAQCVAFVPITFSLIPWPPMLVTFADSLYMLTADLMAIFGDVCKLHTGFYLRFMFQMFFLPLLYVGTLVAYVLAMGLFKYGCCACCKRREKLFTNESTRTRLFEILFLVTYTFYTSVSTTIFRVFKCKDIEGKWFLEANYKVQCFEGTWWSYAVFASAGVLIYIIGVPLVLFVLLWRNRHYLYEETCLGLQEGGGGGSDGAKSLTQHALVKRRLGAIYEAYEKDSYYFDLVDMLRRLLLTGGLIVLGEHSNSQILLGALVCMCWLCLLLARKPYAADWDNMLSSMLAFQLLVIILTGMSLEIYRLTPAFAQDPLEQGAFSMLMLAATGLVLAIGVSTLLFAIPCVQRSECAAACCDGALRQTHSHSGGDESRRNRKGIGARRNTSVEPMTPMRARSARRSREV